MAIDAYLGDWREISTTVLKITIPVSFGKNRTNVTRMSVLIRPMTLT
jgi:hypothetical protein